MQIFRKKTVKYFNFLQFLQVTVWEDHLPQVEMYHKVKSNSDPRLLNDLFDMGMRFQLTTKKDFSALESAGIPTSDSVLISPAKMNSLLKEANKAHVPFLSFDCENELIKIAKFHQDAELLLDLSSFKFPEGEFSTSLKEFDN